jgi:hypothetical protein
MQNYLFIIYLFIFGSFMEEFYHSMNTEQVKGGVLPSLDCNFKMKSEFIRHYFCVQ